MNDGQSRSADDTGSWTSETLPLHVRRELLERELKKLGFRKHGAHEGGSAQQQQQQPQGGSSSHPHAGDGGGGGGGHGD